MPDLASCMTISILRFEHPQSREALDVDGADHGAIYWSTRINDLQLDGTLSGTGTVGCAFGLFDEGSSADRVLDDPSTYLGGIQSALEVLHLKLGNL